MTKTLLVFCILTKLENEMVVSLLVLNRFSSRFYRLIKSFRLEQDISSNLSSLT